MSLQPSAAIRTQAIFDLAAKDNIAYALDSSGQLVRLDTSSGELRRLDVPECVAIAVDAGLAIALTKRGSRATQVEAWDLATLRVLRSRVFEDGVEGSVSAAGHRVFLKVKFAPRPAMPITSIPSPIGYTAVWNVALDRVDKVDVPDHCGFVKFAPDGVHLACNTWLGVSVSNFDEPEEGKSIRLAPEWMPPPRSEQVAEFNRGRKPQVDTIPWTANQTLAWTGNSALLIVGYARLEGSGECRMERWNITAPSGGLERLETLRGRCCLRVLTASSDGSLILTRDCEGGVALRRAPEYEPHPLAVGGVTAATFVADDTRFVTGHGDGVLRIWDTDSIKLVAVVSLRQGTSSNERLVGDIPPRPE